MVNTAGWVREGRNPTNYMALPWNHSTPVGESSLSHLFIWPKLLLKIPIIPAWESFMPTSPLTPSSENTHTYLPLLPMFDSSFLHCQYLVPSLGVGQKYVGRMNMWYHGLQKSQMLRFPDFLVERIGYQAVEGL